MNRIRSIPHNKGRTTQQTFIQKATMLLSAFTLCLVFFGYDVSVVLANQSIDTGELLSNNVASGSDLPDRTFVEEAETESTENPLASENLELEAEDSFLETESVISVVDTDSADSTFGDVNDPADKTSSSDETDTVPVSVSMTTVDDADEVLDDPVGEESSTTSSSTTTQDEAGLDEEVVSLEESGVIDTSAVATRSENNFFQFSKSECSLVADGSYYCFEKPTTNVTSVTEDGLYALLGKQGYMDIVLVQDGKSNFITNNTYDDLAPMYDPVSDSMVWHRIVDDRYVIVSYDVKTKTETILTDGRTNDMQPVRAGAITVWQRWVGNTWQIIMLRGGVETQLSNSTTPNVGASINGDFILWNTTSAAGEKEVMVYELSTGRTTAIADADGGYVFNPRFVLVYDTQLDNGDTITKGFDPRTGEVVPLAAVPGQPPALPSPDPSGETRALINNKTSSGREDYDELDPYNPESFNQPNSTSTLTGSARTTESVADLAIVASTTTFEAPIELNEFDLVVTPYETTAELATTSVQ